MEVDSLEEVGDENREHWKANNLKLIFKEQSGKYHLWAALPFYVATF